MISPLLTCGCSTRRWHSKALQNTTTWWWRVFHRTPCHVHNNIKPRGTLQSRLRRTLYEPAQGLFTGLSVWLCSRSRMNLRKACSQVSQSGSVLGPAVLSDYYVSTAAAQTLFCGWPIMVNDMHTRRRRRLCTHNYCTVTVRVSVVSCFSAH